MWKWKAGFQRRANFFHFALLKVDSTLHFYGGKDRGEQSSTTESGNILGGYYWIDLKLYMI
jgi:hypothetical protein